MCVKGDEYANGVDLREALAHRVQLGTHGDGVNGYIVILVIVVVVFVFVIIAIVVVTAVRLVVVLVVVFVVVVVAAAHVITTLVTATFVALVAVATTNTLAEAPQQTSQEASLPMCGTCTTEERRAKTQFGR